jgi:hypothetical protein
MGPIRVQKSDRIRDSGFNDRNSGLWSAAACGRFKLDEQVKMLRHKHLADKQKAHLNAKLPEAFDKAPAEPITLKKFGTVMGAADGELQQSGGKMAFGGWRDQR